MVKARKATTPKKKGSAKEVAVPETVAPDVVKAEFGRRLQAALVKKGWNQSELARQSALHTPNGRFNRDNVSNYVRGMALPGPIHLDAMAKALGVKPDDLLPNRIYRGDNKVPPLDMRDTGDGRVWLRVNQAVDKSVALDVIQLLMKQD